MSLPYFFVEKLAPETQNLTLNEEQSKHVIQVLRMQKGDAILLTDGKGSKAHAHIIDDHRKRCEAKIISIDKAQERLSKISIAISLLHKYPCRQKVLHLIHHLTILFLVWLILHSALYV